MLSRKGFSINDDYTYYGIITTNAGYNLFGFQFRNTVIIHRNRFIFFLVEPGAFTVKYKVRGKMDETAAILFANMCYRFDCCNICSFSFCMMGFAIVRYRKGRGVDYDIRPAFFK